MNWLLENWIVPILAIIILIIFIRIKKRGFFWLDKKANKLSLKQFLKRWKDGIETTSPLEQCFIQLLGMWITITGIIAGIVVNALVRMKDQWWWIEIILVGSLIVTGVSLLGLYQKYIIYKRVDKEMKRLQEEIK